MSQSDKTKQKLVDSMRKTKSGTTGKSEPAVAGEQESSQLLPPKAEKGSSKKPAARRSGMKESVKKEVDSYQSIRRRVWPD